MKKSLAHKLVYNTVFHVALKKNFFLFDNTAKGTPIHYQAFIKLQKYNGINKTPQILSFCIYPSIFLFLTIANLFLRKNILIPDFLMLLKFFPKYMMQSLTKLKGEIEKQHNNSRRLDTPLSIMNRITRQKVTKEAEDLNIID